MPPPSIPFPLDAADFYMDTISWSNEEVGIYFRLLLVEWIHGPLPSEEKKLQKICQIGGKKWSKSWQKIGKKFELNDDEKFINYWVEKLRKKQSQTTLSVSAQNTKLEEDIERACNYLEENEIFPGARAWKDEMLEQGKSERVIMHVLMRCAIEKKPGMSAQEFCMKMMEEGGEKT